MVVAGKEVHFLANEYVKSLAKESGVYLWEIAKQLQLADSSFSRKLRNELSDNDRARVISIIESIKSKR